VLVKGLGVAKLVQGNSRSARDSRDTSGNTWTAAHGHVHPYVHSHVNL